MEKLTDNLTKLLKKDARTFLNQLFKHYGLQVADVDKAVTRGKKILNEIFYARTTFGKLDSTDFAALAVTEVLEEQVNFRTTSRAFLCKMIESFLSNNGYLSIKQKEVIWDKLFHSPQKPQKAPKRLWP